MSELYWITRLNGINDCLCIFLVITVVFTFIFTIIYLINKFNYDYDSENIAKFFGKHLKWLYPFVLILALIYVFIPTTKEAFIIYGVGGTIDYIKQDSTATQIPHKVIVAIDKYIEEFNENKQD